MADENKDKSDAKFNRVAHARRKGVIRAGQMRSRNAGNELPKRVSQAELAMKSMMSMNDMLGIDLDNPMDYSDVDFDDFDDGGDPNDPDYMLPSVSDSEDVSADGSGSGDDVVGERETYDDDDLPFDGVDTADNPFEDTETSSDEVFEAVGTDVVDDAKETSETVSEASDEPAVSDSQQAQIPSRVSGGMTESDRVTFGLHVWSDALGKLSDDVSTNEPDEQVDERGTHVNRKAREPSRRGGRAAAKKGPVQIRGVQRSLFELVSAEFPSLTNSKALEAFIAKATGRFDLVEDDEVRLEAMRASNVDGTISGLCNEMRAVRRSLRALRLETSTSALASIMNGVDAPDDELSEALFLRIKELRAVSSAYDAAMSSSGGRIPKGYE